MKKLMTIFLIAVSATALGQSADDYLQSGIEKHKKQDFEGAINDYSKAIKANKEFRDAYFNRGICALQLKDLKSAMNDFNKTIELDPKFAKAYYNRAAIYSSKEKYVDALVDLDKTIELDQAIPNSFSLRGQIRARTGNVKGACEDFHKGKENGDKQADKYLKQYCDNEELGRETFMLDWPDSENWKVGNDQENAQEHLIELIHTNETIDKWTELGNMSSYKGIAGVPVYEAMNLKFDHLKQNAPKAKLTFIEKDENAEYPWIIFTIEAPGFKNDKIPESQLWYIVQGKQALYVNFIAIKKATISPELKEKWAKFFKTGKIVMK